MAPLQLTGLIVGYLFIGVIVAVLIYRDDQKHQDGITFAKTDNGYTVAIFIWPILFALVIGGVIYIGFTELSDTGAKVIRFFDFILPPWKRKEKKELDHLREEFEQVRDRLIRRYEEDPDNFVDYDGFRDELRDELRVAYEEEDLNFDNIRIQGEPINYVNWPPYDVPQEERDIDEDDGYPQQDITPY